MFAQSKWNMDEILAFLEKLVLISGLKIMVKSGLEEIFLKFLNALTMSFLSLNLYFCQVKTPPFYEVNSFNRKWRRMEEFQK